MPSDFLLIVDMNSIKMLGLGQYDSSLYNVIQGGPYYSNYVALAYNEATQTFYYSDVNR